MLTIFIRTLILYILIIFALRVMGKRQIGELQPSELVVTILISNIATLPIEDLNIPLMGGLIPILTLVCFEVIMSSLTLKSEKLRRIISGRPLIVIRDGQIDQAMLKKLRFSVEDLMSELRMKDVFDIRDVLFAIIETTGKISIYKKFPQQNVVNQDMNIQKSDPGPQIIVVSDGVVQAEGLYNINRDQKWLKSKLRESKVDLKEVFIMTCNKSGDFYIVHKAIIKGCDNKEKTA